jgi:hypothetical protein
MRELCFCSETMTTYVTVIIARGGTIILPWRMMEIQFDWTFAKLFEVALVQADDSSRVTGQPVCFLSRDIKCLQSESVQVALEFNTSECCRINGSFVKYLHVSM